MSDRLRIGQYRWYEENWVRIQRIEGDAVVLNTADGTVVDDKPSVLACPAAEPRANFGSIEARLSKGHVTGDRPSDAPNITSSFGSHRPSKEEIQAKMEKAKQMELAQKDELPDSAYAWYYRKHSFFDWAKQGI